MLLEATPQRKESPDARTLLDVSMKIKWLLDVCLSPGQELHLWEVLQDPQREKITAQQLFMFPILSSSHTEESRALLVLPLPINLLSRPLSLLPLSDDYTTHV